MGFSVGGSVKGGLGHLWLVLPGEVGIHKPPADHAGEQVPDLVKGALLSDVMPPRNFGDVAVKMPDAHAVIGAGIPSLHHGPEALHAVDVGFISDVFARAVADGRVGRQPFV